MNMVFFGETQSPRSFEKMEVTMPRRRNLDFVATESTPGFFVVPLYRNPSPAACKLARGFVAWSFQRYSTQIPSPYVTFGKKANVEPRYQPCLRRSASSKLSLKSIVLRISSDAKKL